MFKSLACLALILVACSQEASLAGGSGSETTNATITIRDSSGVRASMAQVVVVDPMTEDTLVGESNAQGEFTWQSKPGRWWSLEASLGDEKIATRWKVQSEGLELDLEESFTFRGHGAPASEVQVGLLGEWQEIDEDSSWQIQGVAPGWSDIRWRGSHHEVLFFGQYLSSGQDNFILPEQGSLPSSQVVFGSWDVEGMSSQLDKVPMRFDLGELPLHFCDEDFEILDSAKMPLAYVLVDEGIQSELWVELSASDHQGDFPYIINCIPTQSTPSFAEGEYTYLQEISSVQVLDVEPMQLSDLETSNQLEIGVWVRLDSNPGENMRLVHKLNDWEIKENNGRIQMSFGPAYALSQDTLKADWNYVVFQVSQLNSSATIELYINGVLSPFLTNNFATSYDPGRRVPGSEVFVMADNDGDYPWDGAVSGVRLGTTIHTAEWVMNSFLGGQIKD